MDRHHAVNDSIRSVATTATLATRHDRDLSLLPAEKLASNDTATQIDEPPGQSPSILLLFSLLPRRQTLLFLLPAIFASVVAGGIAPFMTWVVGQAFNVFSEYSIATNPSQEDKERLIRGIRIVAIELVALAAGALILGIVTSTFWIWTGERNVKALRERVYASVTRKDMVWFDMKVGAEGQHLDEDGPVGAGGMMSRFSKYAYISLFLGEKSALIPIIH
jgi:ATP-binding cassette subfamily B (MDR/TAP) protein 1